MTGVPENNACPEDRDGLTPIHRRIHCAATDDTPEMIDEIDQIAIDNFLDNFAEVALAIVHRKQIKR